MESTKRQEDSRQKELLLELADWAKRIRSVGELFSYLVAIVGAALSLSTLVDREEPMVFFVTMFTWTGITVAVIVVYNWLSLVRLALGEMICKKKSGADGESTEEDADAADSEDASEEPEEEPPSVPKASNVESEEEEEPEE